MQGLMKMAAGRGHLQLAELPEPEPRAGEVRIRVAAAGICGTDLHIRDGEYPSHPPVVLGHEFAGVVDAVGGGVTAVREGDRVVAQPQVITCGTCRHCQRGELNLCAGRRSIGSGVHGAFAPALVVPARVVHALPGGVDLVHGALMEPLAVAVHAVLELGAVERGERVLVTGPGPIGLLCGEVARAAGADVLLTGLAEDAERLALGARLGLRTLALPRAGAAEAVAAAFPGGADRALECSGAGPAVELCLAALRAQGTLVQVGLCGAPRSIALDLLTMHEIRAVGCFAHATSSWRRALALAGDGAVQLGPLISRELPLAEWETAFALLDRREAVKVLFRPGT